MSNVSFFKEQVVNFIAIHRAGGSQALHSLPLLGALLAAIWI
jgi:hypothetical protein